ncbi:hypothetical protein [Herbaspirillum sp. GW103]|uniref:hypothetical protein n=1 Tax=Herbaspirillum sp. GW103 TaxID=1175306 RepID=UPI0012F6B6C1|nr:hypothetical protein [Herbaspirillum sp. GW103]
MAGIVRPLARRERAAVINCRFGLKYIAQISYIQNQAINNRSGENNYVHISSIREYTIFFDLIAMPQTSLLPWPGWSARFFRSARARRWPLAAKEKK